VYVSVCMCVYVYICVSMYVYMCMGIYVSNTLLIYYGWTFGRQPALLSEIAIWVLLSYPCLGNTRKQGSIFAIFNILTSKNQLNDDVQIEKRRITT